MIKVFDGLIDYETNLKFYNLAIKLNPTEGKPEPDRQDKPVNSTAIGMYTSGKHTTFLAKKIASVFPEVNKMTLYRSSVNVYPPGGNPYWHVDSAVTAYTCLFYFNPKVHLDEHGETQFIINGEIRGILPKPGRLVIFDGTIQHRATTFRSVERVTVAIRYAYNVSDI